MLPVARRGCVAVSGSLTKVVRRRDVQKSATRNLQTTAAALFRSVHTQGPNLDYARSQEKQYFTPGPLDPEVQLPDHEDKPNKKLFCDGPLSVSDQVKHAMLRDIGPRDPEFIQTINWIRHKLLETAEISPKEYTAILLQGTGTFSLEAVFQTTVQRDTGKVLVLENGWFGKRLGDICKIHGYNVDVFGFEHNKKLAASKVEHVLKDNPDITTVAMVHCETSSGIINPVTEIGRLVKQYVPNGTFIVDSLAGFGAIPVDIEEACVDYLVGSCNKCIEGIPGFAFTIAKLDNLLKCQGNAGTMCLDLVAQYIGFQMTGQLRFTPPMHSILAFAQALKEFEEEGGVTGRCRRYKKTNQVLREGMARMGFHEVVSKEDAGYVLTAFHHPKHPNYDKKTFQQKLNEKDIVIYSGNVLGTDCMKISNMGRLHPHDMRHLLKTIKDVCKDMNIDLPLKEH